MMSMVEFVIALCLEDGTERGMRLRKMYPWRFEYNDQVSTGVDLIESPRVCMTRFDLTTDTHYVYLFPVEIDVLELGEVVAEMLEAGWVEE